MSYAAPLAEELARRPDLLDGLIDASAFAPVGDVAALAVEMRAVEPGADYQAILEHVRRVVGDKRFALGAQIVAGVRSARRRRRATRLWPRPRWRCWRGRRSRSSPARTGACRTASCSSSRSGASAGGATDASDLDLVYLFTGDFDAESDWGKPLGATLYYNRLAQRVTAALSVATAAGPLYPVDTRLRPSGAQGPLAVSLDSFARYQREDAWTWEHMALTRARPVFGSAAARAAVQAVIDRVLAGDRPARDVPAEAAAMRAEMAKHKPPTGPLDAKLLPGGLSTWNSRCMSRS
ncbi:hypothetical protein AB5I41_13935 [Sphingomonas sp. MMS24-JH45]